MPADSESVAIHFTEDEVRAIYQSGLRLYQRALYAKAALLFELACSLKPFGPDYAFALALSYKMLARHEEALPLFILAGELAEHGMKARMHAAECLLRLQRKQEAIELLRTLLSDAGSDVDPVLKKRAEAWLQLAEQ